MGEYKRKVNYYETDPMGITHHSNYIRFMEEARMQLLEDMGWPMKRLEELGLTSPVVSVSCQYKRPTTYGDVLSVETAVTRYTGVSLSISYSIKKADGETAVTAESVHCFINSEGKPVAIKKLLPELDQALKALPQSLK